VWLVTPYYVTSICDSFVIYFSDTEASQGLLLSSLWWRWWWWFKFCLD